MTFKDYAAAMEEKLSCITHVPDAVSDESTPASEAQSTKSGKHHSVVTMQLLLAQAKELAEIDNNENMEDVEPTKYLQMLADQSGISMEDVKASFGDVVV